MIDGHRENGQIINTPWSIENQSAVTISVNAEVYAVINSRSDMTLSTSSLATSTSRNKRAFIYLDKRVTDPGTDLASLDWDQTVYNNKTQILVTEAGLERNNFMTLAGAAADVIDNIAVHITFTFRPTAAPAA